MSNDVQGLPKFINKEINFEWLFQAYRFGNFYNTLQTMSKDDVANMLISLDYQCQQMIVKQEQSPIPEGKFKAINEELRKIKDVIMKNLSDRIETYGSLI